MVVEVFNPKDYQKVINIEGKEIIFPPKGKVKVEVENVQNIVNKGLIVNKVKEN